MRKVIYRWLPKWGTPMAYILHAFFWVLVSCEEVSSQRSHEGKRYETTDTQRYFTLCHSQCFWCWQLEERINRLSTELAKRKPTMLLHVERIQHLQTALNASGVSFVCSVFTTWQEKWLHLLIVWTLMDLKITQGLTRDWMRVHQLLYILHWTFIPLLHSALMWS